MPKYQIINEAGTRVTDDLRDLLKRHFSEREIEKLERLGGRVVISLTAPYVSKSRREASKKIIIDQGFVEKLKELQRDPVALRTKLENLNGAQLRDLCGQLGVPMGSKNTSMELRSQLVRNLEASDFWRRISGSTSPLETDEVSSKKVT